jgi:nucleotide-binding universal stress UspA family protein
MRTPQVIVGIGEPPGGHCTLRWAVAEAVRRGRPLRIIHVARPDACHSPDHPEALALGHARKVVDTAVAEARELAPTIRVTGDAALGRPAASLVAAADRHDLLVVGDRERPGVDRPTCLLVARRARSPVVVVRGGDGPETGPVAVGYDGSPSAEPALVAAFESAAARACPLTVIRAAPLPVPGPADGPRSPATLESVTARATFAADTRRAVAPLTDKYPDVAVDILVTGGDPAGQLVAASREARLVVIGSPGPVGLRLLRHSRCPVLVARP